MIWYNKSQSINFILIVFSSPSTMYFTSNSTNNQSTNISSCFSIHWKERPSTSSPPWTVGSTWDLQQYSSLCRGRIPAPLLRYPPERERPRTSPCYPPALLEVPCGPSSLLDAASPGTKSTWDTRSWGPGMINLVSVQFFFFFNCHLIFFLLLSKDAICWSIWTSGRKDKEWNSCSSLHLYWDWDLSFVRSINR